MDLVKLANREGKSNVLIRRTMLHQTAFLIFQFNINTKIYKPTNKKVQTKIMLPLIEFIMYSRLLCIIT